MSNLESTAIAALLNSYKEICMQLAKAREQLSKSFSDQVRLEGIIRKKNNKIATMLDKIENYEILIGILEETMPAEDFKGLMDMWDKEVESKNEVTGDYDE